MVAEVGCIIDRYLQQGKEVIKNVVTEDQLGSICKERSIVANDKCGKGVS